MLFVYCRCMVEQLAFAVPSPPSDTVIINSRCTLRIEGEQRVVVISGLPVHHYSANDPVAEAYAMVFLVDSGFASRAIGLDPRVADDETLAEATASYRLLRITPQQQENAPDGPGDLAWIWWPIGLAFLLGRWSRRPGLATRK